MRRSISTIHAVSLLVSSTLAADFRGVGVPTGSWRSYVVALSGDGSAAVVGSSPSVGNGIYQRWTRSGGLELPSLELSYVNSGGISYDGAVIVGARTRPSPASGSDGVRWTPATGNVIVTNRVGFDGGSAGGVAADGSVVVGQLDRPGWVGAPYRWTAAGGAQVLPNMPGDSQSYATAVSGDGRVVVGLSATPNVTPYQACRWVDGAPQALGAPEFWAMLSAASYDGSAAAGRGGWWPNDGRALRWTAAGGFEVLADPLGRYQGSEAVGISWDGQTIVGNGTIANVGVEAFIWAAGAGMRPLAAVLAELGVDTSLWRDLVVSGVSADGLTIAGNGLNIAAGRTEGWVATIPEPNVLLLVGVALLPRPRSRARAGRCSRAGG